jgi:hypothetical protein
MPSRKWDLASNQLRGCQVNPTCVRLLYRNSAVRWVHCWAYLRMLQWTSKALVVSIWQKQVDQRNDWVATEEDRLYRPAGRLPGISQLPTMRVLFKQPHCYFMYQCRALFHNLVITTCFCGLFNDTLSGSDYIASNDIGWIMNWKGYGRKPPCPILRYCFGICLEELSKTADTLVGIASLQAETWTRDLPNMKQSC